MFSSNEDDESFLFGSIAKSFDVDVPPEFKEEFVNEFLIDGKSRSNLHEESSDDEVKPKAKKSRGYQPREHIRRVPKEESAWYRRYLAADKRYSIQLGESDVNASPADIKLASQFKLEQIRVNSRRNRLNRYESKIPQPVLYLH